MSDKKTASNIDANRNIIIVGLSVALVVFALLFINEKSKFRHLIVHPSNFIENLKFDGYKPTQILQNVKLIKED